ncbi:hypothetical protein [Catenuloplanes atrovinosus]|uniref:Uncharacterized protein n=1 Tax=Catenuloplanes atrovinosus TaxID=137266 RepID=A0AAE3YSF8_9ACTN|nr:hypothetical protein [Catenuloplanes atrovinosus]MDR7277593.1 hypothetical protein [Catenuloplanes atrovinosus]
MIGPGRLSPSAVVRMDRAARPRPYADHVIAAVAASIFLITVFTVPEQPCTAADPCGPEPVTATAVGALCAAAVMVYLHRPAAVWAAAASAVLWPLSIITDDSGLGWRAALPLALVAITAGVARLRPAPATGTALRHRTPPRPAQLPQLHALTALAGTLLLIAGVALGGWTFWRQHAATARENSAETVTAVVRAQVAEDAIEVELPGGQLWNAEVLAATDYPVGATVPVLVDAAGLRQLRTEPYDITLLFVVATVEAGAGAALLSLARAWDRGLHALFTTAQPVREARLVDDGDCLTILVPGPARTADELILPLTETEDTAHDCNRVPSSTRATLYGEPRPGAWCTVQIDETIRTPLGPVLAVETIPYDPIRALPADLYPG